jgi:hypothetical protein
MALQRIPLSFNKQVSFYKLMGCGKNGTFDKLPDFYQWGIFTVHRSGFTVEPADLVSNLLLKKLYGSFISNWLRLFKCEIYSVLLEPIEGHGFWDGKEVFGILPNNSIHEGRIAILTRATIRLNRLNQFWKHVAPVSLKMKSSKGFITSFGIGEIPWIKQATFSVWESKDDMLTFAYGMKEHTEVVKKTREEQWYSEEMFVRFKILGSKGSIRGIDPLKRNL